MPPPLSEEVQRFIDGTQPEALDCSRDYALDQLLSDMILKQEKGK